MTAEDRVSVPEAARRFQLDGPRIYELIFSGELPGGPSRDGGVLVSLSGIRDYLARQPAGH